MLAVALPAAAHADSSPFQSPSGNIACTIDAGAAVCDISDYTYQPPPPPLCAHSELSGVKCTDSSTGHYFRVSRDSYDPG